LLSLPDGTQHRLGALNRAISEEDSSSTGHRQTGDAKLGFAIRVRTPKGERALRSMDLLKVGEAYLDQDLDIEGDFLAALDMRRFLVDWHPWLSFRRFLHAFLWGNVKSDKLEVTKHYDFGDDFYFAFLDPGTRMYSQALYESEQDTLQQAISNKLEYIFRSCRLQPGFKVLDVAAGWGAFSRHAAASGIDVTMLTIAKNQYDYLSNLCASQNLPGRLKLAYESVFAYEPHESYDAIVLLGVAEHLPDYGELSRKLETLLKPGGRVYLDFVAFRHKYSISSFTLRHVFPGRGSPVIVADLLAAFNRRSFEIIAIHNDRHSYFLTFRDWATNLETASATLIRQYGARTYRLFRLYLWAMAHCLHRDGQHV
jgi:cyclopropane-fatty-acyl-phospholipid synthase